MNIEILKQTIEDFFGMDLDEQSRTEAHDLVHDLWEVMESGQVRAAEPDSNGEWQTNTWVKRGILLAFKASEVRDYSINRHFQFRDKDLTGPLPWIGKNPTLRVPPGGSMIRRGCYIGKNVIVVPPALINLGAYVDDGSMIDSHALVGSCAQIGKSVHLSAAAQIGGVLEPVGTVPVIVEDDAFIGGNCGIYEGIQIGKGAVIGAGTILTGSTPIYDCVNETIIQPNLEGPLKVPPYAIVIPGSRPAKGTFAEKHGLNYQTPIIIKYRDPDQSPALAMEDALR